MKPPFKSDVGRIRNRARETIAQGAVTDAERIAIQTYAEIVRWIENDDPSTRRLMEDILKVEEEHAEEFATLLDDLNRK